MDDVALYNEVKGSNEQAFKLLFDRYAVELCTFVEQYVQDEQLAQDIVQEFFIKVWNKRLAIQVAHSFKAYAYRAVYQASLNHLRDEKRKGVKENLEAYENTFASDDVGYADKQEHLLLQQRLQQALDRLPPQCHRIFMLVHYEEMKYEEVANTLGLSVNTIKVQMSKAYRLLRESLGSSEFGFILIAILYAL